MSWPLKYRPRTFEELALRDVRQHLQKLVSSGNLPQVFLFAGPKGSGKTSTSRILSHTLNQSLDAEEVEKIFEGTSFVINELDAASNRGIDDIRLLKERAVMPPQLGEKAVYILDEAHMLTKDAFNALLKLLEEPPAHAVFILATTELNKIPETILSRANLVKFRQATSAELEEVLSRILKQEKIEFEAEAVKRVAAQADGSFRDAVKLLEMVCRGEKKLTVASVEILGSLTLKTDLQALVGAVVAKDEQTVVKLVQTFRDQGEDEKYVQKTLCQFLHDDLLRGLGVLVGNPIFAARVNLFLLDHLATLTTTDGPIPFLNLEIKLLDLIFRAKDQASGVVPPKSILSSPKPVFSPQVKKNPPELKPPDVVLVNNLTPSPLKEFISDNLVEPDEADFVSLQGVWQEFLQAVESQNLTLAAIIKSSKLIPNSQGITKIGVYYQFHKRQLEQQKLRNILTLCGQEVAGGTPRFEIVLLESPVADSPVARTGLTTSTPPANAGPALSEAGLEEAVSEALLNN